MKRLVTIFLMVATTLALNAQQKPTKEATVKFIESCLKKTVGTEDKYGNKVTNASFNGNELILNTSKASLEVFYTETYSNFNWDGVDFHVRDDSEKSTISGFEVVYLGFKTSFKHASVAKQYDEVRKSERTFDWLQLHMPSDKIESLNKAFLRLQEIAKEEDKDPFEK